LKSLTSCCPFFHFHHAIDYNKRFSFDLYIGLSALQHAMGGGIIILSNHALDSLLNEVSS